jgi:hypothetical protein
MAMALSGIYTWLFGMMKISYAIYIIGEF